MANLGLKIKKFIKSQKTKGRLNTIGKSSGYAKQSIKDIKMGTGLNNKIGKGNGKFSPFSQARREGSRGLAFEAKKMGFAKPKAPGLMRKIRNYI